VDSSRLIVAKWLDIDPDPENAVLVPVAGWSFVLAGDAATTLATGADGTFSYDFVNVDGSVSVDVTEQLQADFEFVDASCEVTAGGLVPALAPAAVGDPRGTLDAAAMAVRAVVINPTETVTCTFVNESGEVLAETATPRVTPPPTATLPTSGTPGGDSWRIVLLALAGIVASLLLLTPAAPTAIRRRR
jgi:hypothetical protein